MTVVELWNTGNRKQQEGRVIGTGLLRPRTISDRQGRKMWCTFEFSVPDLREADFYQVEVSHRGAVSYSKEELEAEGWFVSLGLPDDE